MAQDIAIETSQAVRTYAIVEDSSTGDALIQHRDRPGGDSIVVGGGDGRCLQWCRQCSSQRSGQELPAVHASPPV